jgi:hypothetical protein
MRITAAQLRKIIKEEAQALSEAPRSSNDSEWKLHWGPIKTFVDMTKSSGGLTVTVKVQPAGGDKIHIRAEASTKIGSMSFGELVGKSKEDAFDKMGARIQNVLDSFGSSAQIQLSSADVPKGLLTDAEMMRKPARGPRYTSSYDNSGFNDFKGDHRRGSDPVGG